MQLKSILQYAIIMILAVLIALAYQFVAGAMFLPALMLGVGLTLVGALLGRGRVITWAATIALAITFVVLLVLVFFVH